MSILSDKIIMESIKDQEFDEMQNDIIGQVLDSEDGVTDISYMQNVSDNDDDLLDDEDYDDLLDEEDDYLDDMEEW